MQRSRSRSAEEVAGSIDTLGEILLRLPAKPLLRFKCVSKQWLALISDPRFCYSHTLHHQTPSALLLPDMCSPAPLSHLHIVPLTTTPTVRVLNLNFLDHPEVSVVRSCNGLLLCHGCSSYFVCNPTTRKFVALNFPNQQFRNQVSALYLAFDPLRSPHFQVLSIRVLGSQNFQALCVFNEYSSRTRSWCDPGVSFIAQSKVIPGAGVYCNRAIHWFYDALSSVYFDIDSQCLKDSPLPLPDEGWGNRIFEYFGVSGGRLHLIFTVQTLKFDILELKEDNSVWSLRHRVDLNPMRIEFPELCRLNLANYVLPVYIVCPTIEENSMLVLVVGGTTISYNPLNHTSRKLCDFEPDMGKVDAVACYMLGKCFQYFENLSSVETFAAY
ncbi:F-box protein At5g07610-like [Gastrolobium bilobum]|uniref:F-box protein At5g07610-like n=1 Tax=Gastrolobium bilobum TaxID=150636 RepID=UPI002AB10601|nr:F-box protein At5g07610-like [Gastrolobium bilobum]